MKKFGKILLFIGMGWWLTGCSGNVDTLDFADLSSRTVVQNSGQIESQNLATCNAFSGGGFSGKIKLYMQNGSYNATAMRLRITSIPSDMEGSTRYIQFFRWLADNQGSFLEPEAVEFYLEDSFSSTPISGMMSDLSLTKLTTLGSEIYGTDDVNYLLSKVNIVLTNITGEWDALKLAHYEDSDLLSESNFLIPAFAANPATYATNHPPVLQQMHPNKSAVGQNLDDRAYLALTHGLCF